MKQYFFLILTILISSSVSYGQTPMWHNQGGLVAIHDSAIVYVQGDFLNDRNGEIDNQGALYVEGNWTNNASNEAFRSQGEGIVHLWGSTPIIGGQSVTRFYDLRLEQSGTASAILDVYVDGFLHLNTQPFFVDTHTVYVYNSDLEAVTHRLGTQWGFVSSEDHGGLYRATDSTAAYWYPVGSSRGTSRFRPVQLRPNNSSPAAFQVGFVNDDPNTDGYDRSRRAYALCGIQPNYYHRIQRPISNTPAQVTLYYDATTDGSWNALAQWTAAQRWDSIQVATVALNSTYNLNTLTSVGFVQQFNPEPVALGERSPTVDLTVALNPICADEATTLTATSSGQSFDRYDFYSNGRLVQSTGSATYVLTQPPSGQLPLWVVGAFAECGDESDTTYLTVYDSVVATVSNDTIILAGTAAELRAGGGNFYVWTPDSALVCGICPTTLARPNQSLRYSVEVQNMDGCSDIASVWVDVRRTIDDVLFVSNVLTPNGDGYNDAWFIRNLDQFPNNTVTIVNRWGDIVYQATNYRNNWEGTYSGGALPAGTYYYVLDVGDDLGIFKGALTIIRE